MTVEILNLLVSVMLLMLAIAYLMRGYSYYAAHILLLGAVSFVPLVVAEPRVWGTIPWLNICAAVAYVANILLAVAARFAPKRTDVT